MSPKPKILHQWQRPEKVAIYETDELFREGRVAAPRILLITATIEIVLYIFIKRYVPEEIEVNGIKLFILVFLFALGLVCFIYLLFPWTIRISPHIYRITDKAILLGSGQPSFFPWHRIEGYWLSQHEQFPELRIVNLQTKKRKRTLVLPEDEQADEIIETINQRIPEITPPLPLHSIKLTKLQYIYLGILTLLYSIACAFLILAFKNKYTTKILLLVTFGFGPGTVGLIHLHGKSWKKDKQLVLKALAFNVLAIAITISILLLIVLCRFSKEFGGS